LRRSPLLHPPPLPPASVAGCRRLTPSCEHLRCPSVVLAAVPPYRSQVCASDPCLVKAAPWAAPSSALPWPPVLASMIATSQVHHRLGYALKKRQTLAPIPSHRWDA